MPRELTDHTINPANERIRIAVMDEPGQGGANHRYLICVDRGNGEHDHVKLQFQDGPVKENGNGVNGITHEALLAILVDRLQGFQSGPYACRENALALTHLQDAQHWLHHRTRAREKRGVEGTHQV